MTGPSILKRLRNLLQHPISPAPLVVVFVGYWMPLAWMVRGGPLLAYSSWTERSHAIATSILLNFVPAALLCAAVAYALAGLISPLFRTSFKQAAAKSLDFITFLLFFASTAELLKDLIIGELPAPVWLKTVSVFIIVLGSLWLTRKNLKLMQWLLIPKYITLAVMPLAIILVFIEIVQVKVYVYSSHANRALPRVARSNANSRPDIILITVDTLSAGHLHTYGYRLPTSPYLDNFSTRAILFENFYANANWTRPGIASILNGARPWTHQGDIGKPIQAVTDAQNLINRLADAGYDVRIVNSNGWVDLQWQSVATVPTHEVQLFSYSFFVPRFLDERIPSLLFASQLGPNQILADHFPKEKTGEYVPQSRILLHSAPTDRPLFFWLHVVSPHGPYATEAPYLGTFEPSPLARTPWTSSPEYGFISHPDSERRQLLAGRYDEAVLMADDVIGQFLDVLKSQGLFERSLVVVTADHGESFNPVYGGHGGPLLTEELIRVPCLIKPPFYRGGKRERLLFEQADLAPTILSFANLPVPRGMEGQAYPSKPNNVPIFSMNRDLQNREQTLNVAMREGDWKYVIHLGRWKYSWPQQELYDLAQDPNEQVNLVNIRPAQAFAMRQSVLAEIVQHGISLSKYRP